MKVAVGHPGAMEVNPQHVLGDRVMVHIAEGGEYNAVLLWVNPENAVQWIEALTPIAAQVKP